MVEIVGPPASAIRNRRIAHELERVLRKAAEATGIDRIRITSGGQPARGEGGRRTGSTRHDHGRAADLQLVQDGRVLTFTDQDADPTVKAFITAAAANGATGIGAGVTYMGNMTIHVGFGTSRQDLSKLVWGAGGRSANAPAWLEEAAREGWRNPAAESSDGQRDLEAIGRFVVVARGGLWLRKGPGLDYDKARLLETGSELTVLAFDGPDGSWARVDLEDDGLVDGHVSAAFIAPAGTQVASFETVEEPDEVGTA